MKQFGPELRHRSLLFQVLCVWRVLFFVVLA